MPNPNLRKAYRKGRDKEYRICKYLRDEGFDIVQRTAGSHSPVDIIAINKKDKKVLLIQSKPKSIVQVHHPEYDEYDWLNGEFEVEFRIFD